MSNTNQSSEYCNKNIFLSERFFF